MMRWLKKNAGPVYVGALTALVCALLFQSGELPEMIRALSSLRFGWVCACALMVMTYLGLRACTLAYYLRGRGYGLGVFNTLVISGVGQFYSAITPSASGGQPVQIMYMRRMGVPISVATAAVSVKFVGFQLSVVLLGGVLWIAHRQFIAAQLGAIRYLVALGFLLNLLLAMAVVVSVFRIDWVRRAAHALIRLAARMRLIKRCESRMNQVDAILDEYRSSLLTLAEHKRDAAVILALSLMQVSAYMLIIVCVYRAFSLEGTDAVTLVCLQTLLFITAANVPLPGAAGAQEGGFYLFFRGVIPEENLLPAIICWRFFTYYLLLAVGLFAIVADGIAGFARRRRGDTH